jgi:hypothetical protein
VKALSSVLFIVAIALLTATATIILARAIPSSRTVNTEESAQAARDATAAIICILSIDPLTRTPAGITDCLTVNGYDSPINLPRVQVSATTSP